MAVQVAPLATATDRNQSRAVARRLHSSSYHTSHTQACLQQGSCRCQRRRTCSLHTCAQVAALLVGRPKQLLEIHPAAQVVWPLDLAPGTLGTQADLAAGQQHKRKHETHINLL